MDLLKSKLETEVMLVLLYGENSIIGIARAINRTTHIQEGAKNSGREIPHPSVRKALGRLNENGLLTITKGRQSSNICRLTEKGRDELKQGVLNLLQRIPRAMIKALLEDSFVDPLEIGDIKLESVPYNVSLSEALSVCYNELGLEEHNDISKALMVIYRTIKAMP